MAGWAVEVVLVWLLLVPVPGSPQPQHSSELFPDASRISTQVW